MMMMQRGDVYLVLAVLGIVAIAVCGQVATDIIRATKCEPTTSEPLVEVSVGAQVSTSTRAAR